MELDDEDVMEVGDRDGGVSDVEIEVVDIGKFGGFDFRDAVRVVAIEVVKVETLRLLDAEDEDLSEDVAALNNIDGAGATKVSSVGLLQF